MELKGDIDVACEKIIDKIRISEDQILSGLDNLYESLPTQVFKTMRKALPGKRLCLNIQLLIFLVTNTKMDWNLHVHKMVNTLKHR